MWNKNSYVTSNDITSVWRDWFFMDSKNIKNYLFQFEFIFQFEIYRRRLYTSYTEFQHKMCTFVIVTVHPMFVFSEQCLLSIVLHEERANWTELVNPNSFLYQMTCGTAHAYVCVRYCVNSMQITMRKRFVRDCITRRSAQLFSRDAVRVLLSRDKFLAYERRRMCMVRAFLSWISINRCRYRLH